MDEKRKHIPDLELAMARDQALITALDALEPDGRDSKIARFRLLFDAVERALRRNVTQKSILACLNSFQFDLTMGSFKSMLQRVRLERAGEGCSADLDPMGDQLESLIDTTPSAQSTLLSEIFAGTGIRRRTAETAVLEGQAAGQEQAQTKYCTAVNMQTSEGDALSLATSCVALTSSDTVQAASEAPVIMRKRFAGLTKLE
ncbi:protein of unknown function [Cupriavidus taiwanensis]|uniref:Uncharacterized protein n=1 Tax=Cupriavidus taiwanensis TaxID=164546 RepID=A0A375I9S8_9BURK|nr:protein of unknown function [Cupriavidus taiwanensis]